MASSNDTQRIQTNNLAVTPQPMTAALIFRRQLVRRNLFNLLRPGFFSTCAWCLRRPNSDRRGRGGGHRSAAPPSSRFHPLLIVYSIVYSVYNGSSYRHPLIR
jgi:hypothetical protein